MKLIVDAGSTKIEWAVLEEGGRIQRVTTQGFNPNYASREVFDAILNELPNHFTETEELYYYGSGCASEANRQMVFQMVSHVFYKAGIHVGTDLLGACHAVLGHQKGIACILGTGANSCVFDGSEITHQAVSLGYLVGDEGSGCYIGRKLTRAYFYELMPAELKLEFDNTYHLNIKEFIDKVYHQPAASKYLAGFTKFAGDHVDHPFIQNLVKDCFADFIKVFLLRYEECRALPVGFVGSVAYHFQGLLQQCLASEGLTMGKVMRSPMDGLIQLYS